MEQKWNRNGLILILKMFNFAKNNPNVKNRKKAIFFIATSKQNSIYAHAYAYINILIYK